MCDVGTNKSSFKDLRANSYILSYFTMYARQWLSLTHVCISMCTDPWKALIVRARREREKWVLISKGDVVCFNTECFLLALVEREIFGGLLTFWHFAIIIQIFTLSTGNYAPIVLAFMVFWGRTYERDQSESQCFPRGGRRKVPPMAEDTTQ